jgi:hypothetical protein
VLHHVRAEEVTIRELVQRPLERDEEQEKAGDEEHGARGLRTRRETEAPPQRPDAR